jgi:hypothetical protein
MRRDEVVLYLFEEDATKGSMNEFIFAVSFIFVVKGIVFAHKTFYLCRRVAKA